MITNRQYDLLVNGYGDCKNCKIASAKAGMCEKTGRKYLKMRKKPSDLKKKRTWKTRDNPFQNDWSYITSQLEINPGLEAKTLFNYLNTLPGRNYQLGQLRTLQRKIKQWRATEGPDQEVFFDQVHYPGELGAADFTDMNALGITISGVYFPHKIFHFVLTYSNWETGTICFSESFESILEGLQNALWSLGSVPKRFRTDCLTAAVNNLGSDKTFQKKYMEFLDYYQLQAERTNPNSPHENGDSEQSHFRFKNAVEQALLLRNNRNFESREAYQLFLEKLFVQLNKGRLEKLEEEYKVMQPLPSRRIDSCTELRVRVRRNSTILVKKQVYSVHSRLINEQVNVRLYADCLEIEYGQKLIEKIPRIKGSGKARIDYRHIIHSLLKKPGAFENYVYREELFPSTHFRIAYDLFARQGKSGIRQYLYLLRLATEHGESTIQRILEEGIKHADFSMAKVYEMLTQRDTLPCIDLEEYHLPCLDEYDNIVEEQCQ